MWAESVGALSVLLLVSLLVITVPLGLVMFQVDVERQSALAQALAETLCTVLSEDEPGPDLLDPDLPDPGAPQARMIEVFGALESSSVPADQIYVVDRRLHVVAAVTEDADVSVDPQDEALLAALAKRTTLQVARPSCL